MQPYFNFLTFDESYASNSMHFYKLERRAIVTSDGRPTGPVIDLDVTKRENFEKTRKNI